MNLAFDNMIVPGSMSNYLSSNHNIQPFTPSYSWYLGINKQPIGPLCEAELIERLIKHQIDKDTLAWRIGMTKWEPIKSIPEILKLILLLPPSL